MFRLALLFCVLCQAFSGVAAQLKLSSLTVGSQVYSNVNIIGANATDLYFTHAHGVANVKLKYLSPDLQKQFHYDPAAAAEAEQRQSRLDSLYQAEVKSKMTVKPAPTNSIPRRSSDLSLGDAVSEKSPLGKAGPTLRIENWLGKQAAFNGKFVLFSFWAPWSVPSRKVIPDLNALQKKFADRLVVVGIAANTDADEVGGVEPKIEYASALDSSGKLAAAAGVTSVPTVLLLDPAGTLLYAGHPAAVTDKLLQGILEQKP